MLAATMLWNGCIPTDMVFLQAFDILIYTPTHQVLSRTVHNKFSTSPQPVIIFSLHATISICLSWEWISMHLSKHHRFKRFGEQIYSLLTFIQFAPSPHFYNLAEILVYSQCICRILNNFHVWLNFNMTLIIVIECHNSVMYRLDIALSIRPQWVGLSP